MRGKKKILEALPSLDAVELELVYRDVRRAADVAAIGGTERDWNHYRDVENAILDELGKRFPDREMRGVRGYLDKKPGEIDSLKAVYAKIFKKGGGK